MVALVTAALLGSVALLHVLGETGGEVDVARVGIGLGAGVGLGDGVGLGAGVVDMGVVSMESLRTPFSMTEVGVTLDESSSDAFI